MLTAAGAAIAECGGGSGGGDASTAGDATTSEYGGGMEGGGRNRVLGVVPIKCSIVLAIIHDKLMPCISITIDSNPMLFARTIYIGAEYISFAYWHSRVWTAAVTTCVDIVSYCT